MIELSIKTGDFEEAVGRAAELLARGGVGIIPTETVYGLAGLASDERAVARLLRIKERPADKPLPVQVSSVAGAKELVFIDRPEALALTGRYWPGPLTLVLPLRPGVELPHQGSDTVGVRLPACDFCRALIDRAGPLVVPSANRSGEPPPVSLEEVSRGIIRLVDFAVDGGRCPGGTESTVVDLVGAPRVLREGAISTDDIEKVVGEVGGDG